MSLVKMKDPDEVLPYTIDWSDWLVGGDTVSTSSWSATLLTVDSDTNDTTTTTVTTSAGTAGQAVRVTNRITTVNGLTGERSIVVRIEQR